MRLFKGSHWLYSAKSNKGVHAVSSAVLLGSLFILGVFLVRVWYRDRCEDRIDAIKINLKTLRRYVSFLYEKHGIYPDSFAQLRGSLIQSGSGNWDRLYVDLASDRQAEVPEYRELNNKGGYYYDPNRGEIRLNLTRPVREYLRWYGGSYADQIPSHW